MQGKVISSVKNLTTVKEDQERGGIHCPIDNQPTNQSINQSVGQSINQSMRKLATDKCLKFPSPLF